MTPNDEAAAIEEAYLAQLRNLYAHFVTNLTTGNTDDAVDRFARGVEISRQALQLALQGVVIRETDDDGNAQA